MIRKRETIPAAYGGDICLGRGKNSCVFGASEKPMVPTAPHLAATLTVESCPFAGTDVGYDRVPPSPIYTAVRPYSIIVPSLHSCIYQEYIVLYTYTRRYSCTRNIWSVWPLVPD